jgi:hypothetical protein
MGTRASNAEKHPGIPDQRSKRRSPAEMATYRSEEKALKDRKEAAELAASSVIASVEDQMDEADKIQDQNAAWPIPVDIPRAARPISQTNFPNLEDDDGEEQIG